jgi:hypothetical protein
MKPKPPTIAQLVAIIAEYNIARKLELQSVPAGVAGYKNPMMEELYDCAVLAAKQLKPALTVNLEIEPPA